MYLDGECDAPNLIENRSVHYIKKMSITSSVNTTKYVYSSFRQNIASTS